MRFHLHTSKIINKYINMIKNDCNIVDKKIEPFVKDLNYHIEILNNFTLWINEKVQNCLIYLPMNQK